MNHLDLIDLRSQTVGVMKSGVSFVNVTMNHVRSIKKD